MKYACPCCDCFTMDEPYSFEFCPVCRYQDDRPFPHDGSDYPRGANRVYLSEARRNFAMFGVSEERFIGEGRPPTSEEISGPQFSEGGRMTVGAEVLYDERVASFLPFELPHVVHAYRIVVDATHLQVTPDGHWSATIAEATPRTFPGMHGGFVLHERLTDLPNVEVRRLPLLQFAWECLRPYQGMGFTAEWKYRIRGVRTGVAVGAPGGVKAWISTKRPHELLRAIRQGQRDLANRADDEKDGAASLTSAGLQAQPVMGFRQALIKGFLGAGMLTLMALAVAAFAIVRAVARF